MFRREWRQQILVLTLLTVAVAATTFSGAFGYNFPRTQDATFGSAQQRITFSASGPETDDDLAAAREYLGTIDVIATATVPVPGSATRLELRAQDPHGPYSTPMLALGQGRYPTSADDVAVTDEVAGSLQVGVGDRLTLGSWSRTVVGVVENPSDFDDEFALVAPGHLDRRDTVTILTSAGGDRVESFRSRMTVPGNVNRETRPFNERAATALVTLSLAAVGMLLVALIAAAGFVVLAKRRLRQLGMLAALGASEKHVRLVTVVNGALVGLIAAVIGTAVGLVAWAAALGRVEAAAGHRIGGLSAPVWLVATGMLLAVLAATGSAWWPARAVARIPVMLALSSRPPRPKPAHRSAVAAVALISIGLVCLHFADEGKKPVLLLAGMPAILIGVLLSAPVAIRAFARLAVHLPLAGRLALRDLARYQARSGAALAAISLALAIPIGVVVVASAEESQAGATNLSDRQLLFRVGDAPDAILVPLRSDDAVTTLDGRVEQLAATLDGARVLALDMAVDPTMAPDYSLVAGGGRFSTLLFWQPVGSERAHGIPLFVATTGLLERFGAGSTAVDAHEVYFTESAGDLRLFSTKANQTPVTDVGLLPDPGHGALPSAFISPAAVRSHGWEPTRAGWLVESGTALNEAQLSAAKDLAVAAGLRVETLDQRASLSTLRSGATAAGILLALGVLAMTVGLIRSEVAGDLRTLAAVGASSGIRRKLTAATAGTLALLGVVLGVAAAYLALVGAYLGNLDALGHVPVLHLAVTAVGVPVLAAGAGWLLAGREPPVISRAALD
jgi:putative ABC transport system permease protein